MQKKLLDILIPTLNRADSLIKNLENIQAIVAKNKLEKEIGVIISDNGSEAASFKKLESFVEKQFSLDVKLFRQKENIGIEKNCLFLLDQSSAEYVMTLGDDDYFQEGFLLAAMEYLRSHKYSGIIPNFISVDAEGNKISSPRDKIAPDKVYDRDSLWICDRGHQLSCLIFLREGVRDAYLKKVRPNVYPFIYFLGHNLARGEMVHITKFPYACTGLQTKNWDYSFDNLMGEIMCVIDCLPYQNKKDRRKQLKKMLKRNAYRYCNKRTYLHPIKLINAIRHYSVSTYTKFLLTFVYFKHVLLIPVRNVCAFLGRRTASEEKVADNAPTAV